MIPWDKEQERSILVVEDTRVVREVIGAALRQAGYVVLMATQGQEALELMEQNDVNMLISDVRMPVMGGEELVATIRGMQAYRDLPVLLLTADEAAAAVSRDDVSIIEKPIDLKALLAYVSRTLTNRGATATPDCQQTTAELLPLYEDEGRGHLAAIGQALEAGDVLAVKEAAHALKGISITISTTAVEDISPDNGNQRQSR